MRRIRLGADAARFAVIFYRCSHVRPDKEVFEFFKGFGRRKMSHLVVIKTKNVLLQSRWYEDAIAFVTDNALLVDEKVFVIVFQSRSKIRLFGPQIIFEQTNYGF